MQDGNKWNYHQNCNDQTKDVRAEAGSLELTFNAFNAFKLLATLTTVVPIAFDLCVAIATEDSRHEAIEPLDISVSKESS
jgi:hypothetical protein